MASRSVGLLFVLLVVLATQEIMVERAEGKTCDVLSDKYKGPCFLNSKGCDDVCRRQEGLISGLCKGNFNCYCRKNC